MKKLKITLLGKPQRGITFLSTGSLKQDLEKLDASRAKRENTTLVLGTPGTGFKKRVFEASEFRLELVPEYVNVIKQIVEPETGKRYFSYVDTYGKKDSKSFRQVISWLFSKELNE